MTNPTIIVVLVISFGSLLPLAAQRVTLIPTNAVWRYLDTGVDPAPDWAMPGYPDAGWAAGPAPLGWGEGTEATLIAADSDPRPVTTWFRHAFTVTNRQEILTLEARLRRDDGARMLLNGIEFWRNNLPAGPLTGQTPAAALIEGNAERVSYASYPPPTLLVDGTNVLAVELHQHPAGLADARLEPSLTAYYRPEIKIITPLDGGTVAFGSVEVTVAISDPGVTALYFYVDGEFAAAAVSPFRFTWFPPKPGRFTLTVEGYSPFGDRLRTAPVHVQVGEPGPPRVVRGPYLQRGGTSSIVVCWRTDWFTDSTVYFGREPNNLDCAASGAEGVLDHVVPLEGLAPDTEYFYAVGTPNEIQSAGPNHRFRTAPAGPKPTRIWVIGDFGTGGDEQRRVYEAFRAQAGSAPDVWLMLGDNAYGEGTDREYQMNLFEVYAEMLHQAVAWPTLGNHDTYSADSDGRFAYLDIFQLPQRAECGGVPSGTSRYYSFDHGAIHFVCLDSMTSSRATDGAMAAWLRADLEATAAEWIIAYWHHPPYSKGTHDSDAEGELIEMRENLVPLLEAYGVDLVLCGHSHNYERSMLLNGHYGPSHTFDRETMTLNEGSGRPASGGPYTKPAGGLGANRGTVYVVCGNSGQGGYFQIERHPAMYAALTGFGSLVVDVDGDRLDLRYLTLEGEIEDYFTLVKGAPDEDVQPRLAIERGLGGVTLSWPTSKPAWQLEAGRPGQRDSWQPHSAPALQRGRRLVTTEAAEEDTRFFRLKNVP